VLDRRDIRKIASEEIPDCFGFIGGPPCQSWSEAGALRGISDHRGQLFFEYLRLIQAKKPAFFLAENVSGILFSRHNKALTKILSGFTEIGYNVSFGLLSANDYGVAQDRERVIIVGYRTSIDKVFSPPKPQEDKPVLRDVIWDLRNSAQPASDGNRANQGLKIPNHEYMTGGFSSIYMSRNRVRSWDEPSFTIQAGGRHAPLHPQAPKMMKVGKDECAFIKGSEDKYRRLSVRECARIQSFPDDFIFHYKRTKMSWEKGLSQYQQIGNAVPPLMAKAVAMKIKDIIQNGNSKDLVLKKSKQTLLEL